MIFTPDFMATKDNMKIAILSGKGGTGKTLLSVNLAAVAAIKSGAAVYVDCDVEEPNGHLFFKPVDVQEDKVAVKIPVVDQELCTGCRDCVDFCNFNALAYINKQLIVSELICHSCGGCVIVCPELAFTEKDKVIGRVRVGTSLDVEVISGAMNTGIASGIPIIDRLLAEEAKTDADKDTFIDCPPGSACIVMESIKDADYCVLVAEPTLFGVHNLNMVYQLVKIFDKPFGVVINKCTEEDNPAERFCQDNDIMVLGRIPLDHELGLLNSKAQIVARESKKYQKLFADLLDVIMKEAKHETTVNS